MSGMSGDHFGIGGGGVMPHPMKEEGNACLNLVIITNLASVDDNVGDILPVETQSVDGPVVVLKDGDIVGTVLSSYLIRLLNCMNDGTEYKAEVMKIEDAICQVKISAVK